MRVLFGCLILALVVGCRASTTPLEVTGLPEPPQQKTPWTPPSGIPTNLLSAVNTLFEQGLPDPRGCEYREVEIVVSGVWEPGSQTISTRAWILPGTNTAQHYAICWNGLIYPVKIVGPTADLSAEATSLIPPNSLRFNLGLGEARSVFSTNSPSSRILLLLRAGQTEAALKNWVPDEHVMSETQIRMNRSPTEIGKIESYDPYLELAEDWAWAQFDRVLCAHMRGDVPLALAGARQLSELQPKIQAEAERRGFPHPSYSDSLKHEKSPPYLYFLGQLPDLLSDLERRAREPKQTTVIQTGLTNISSQFKQITALIQDLDMVQARQWGQPGMVMPEEDPIVQALINEGDAAVDPLLNCLQNDKRLTRSVGFSRDFQRNRVVISVAAAARAALQNILRVQFRSAAEFRAYWEENKSMKLEDRWYSTLKDDDAGVEQWLQTAANITQPENIIGVPGRGHYTTAPIAPGQKPRIRGEILRRKQNPTVTDLLLKRANEIADQANNLDQFRGVEALRQGTEFTTALAKWDKPDTAVLPAHTLMRRAIELFDDPHSFIGSSGHDLARFIPRLTQIRVDGGDTNALVEYATWIRSAEPKKLDVYILDAFEPLWHNSNSVALAPVGKWLFNDPTSAWSRLPWKPVGFHDPLESDLVKVPAFRRLVVRALDDREVIGTIEWDPHDVAVYNIKDYGGGTRGPIGPPGTERPASGTKVDVRRCDWIAWSLSNGKQIPLFNPFAPVEKRDQAIQNAKAALGRN